MAWKFIGNRPYQIGSRSLSSYWTTPLNAPSGLTLVVLNDTEFRLKWSINATGYDSHSIERSDDLGVTYSEIASISAKNNSYCNTGRTVYVTYYYRVRGLKGAKYSEYTNVVSGATYKSWNYGYLYNWYATQNAAKFTSSDTWRLPSNTEFATLSTLLGGDANASKHLREIGAIHWNANTTPDNSINFTARGTGCRTNSIFQDKDIICYLWTSLEHNATNAYLRLINQDNSTFGVYSTTKLTGLPVRLVRDAVGGDPATDGDYCTDYIGNNGQSYKTIKAGTQVWTAENLIETKYRDGSAISEITVQATWNADTTGARCSYSNDETIAIYSGKFENLGILGDSTVSVYLTYNAVSYYLSYFGTLTDISHAGDTIAQQTTLWNALTSATKLAMKYVFSEVVLNDLDPSESAATALGRLQALINLIKIDATNAKLVLGTMTPCKQRLIDLYGASPGLVAYQKWLDMNNAIRGNGSLAVYGNDDYIDTHTDALNDGSGNLDAAYDTGDHIHENNAGRQIIGTAWMTKL